MEKKYKCFNQRIIKAFKNFDIKCRSFSESTALAIINGKHKYNTYHHITWNGKKVFLRSTYELDYAKELDDNKIDYEVEKLRILYWDSIKLVQRTAIPDFYLTESNTIVEIKSDYTLDIQEMKDKIKAYREHGYKFILILEHKKVPLFVEELFETGLCCYYCK